MHQFNGIIDTIAKSPLYRSNFSDYYTTRTLYLITNIESRKTTFT